MVSNETGKQLHDRATRGEVLSDEEQVQLKSWYATQDLAEANELGLTEMAEKLTALQAQIDAALAQLATATGRIQEIAEENEALRHENAVLRRQLTKRAVAQAV